MLQIRHSPLMRTLVTPITLAAFVSACSSWATMKEPVAVSIADEQPNKVRVTTTDEGVLILTSPFVEADTLSGIVPGTKAELRSVSYALDEVAAVEVWQPSPRGEPSWIATDMTLADLCAEQAMQLRLTLTDGRQVVLGLPEIREDSVVGTALGHATIPRTAIALADVTRVEKYRGDKTGLVVALVGGAVLLGVLAVVASQEVVEGTLGGS